MLSVSNVSGGQALNYYAADDYYTEGSPASFWYGKCSQELELTGEVDSERLSALLRGDLPTGEHIHQGGRERRAGTDLTFSAPKSVSIQACVGGDQRLFAAQEKAVKAALTYAEQFVGARVTVDGVTSFELTQKAVFAVVSHDTSRAGDPNIHNHCLLLNCTSRSDGQWRAVENRGVFEQKTVLDAIYISTLERECRALGYEIKRTKIGFELAHINREQILHFSRRVQDINQRLEQKGLSRETATPGERQLVTLESRSAKEKYNRDDLQREWLQRGKEVDLETSIVEREYSYPFSSNGLNMKGIRNELEHVLNHLSEREASFGKNHVLVEVLRGGKGFITVSEIESALKEKETLGEVVFSADGKKLATEKSLAYEKRILRIEIEGRGKVGAICGDRELVQSHIERHTLNEEQLKAVQLVLESENLIVGINGYAGTGKTTTLKAVVEACEKQDYTIIGLAPSHSAVKALKEAGIEAKTLQSWIADRGARDQLTKNTILMIDEAGLISAKQLSIAFERAEYKGARILLVGDVKQYLSVEAGRSFDQLQKNGMEVAVIKKMLRQKEANLAKAAQLSVHDPIKSLSKLEVKEIANSQDRRHQMARDYAKLTIEERKESLILCGTNIARKEINESIRGLIGLKGNGKVCDTFESKDLTGAEKKRLTSYEVGDLIRFEKAYKSLDAKKGDIWQVLEIKESAVMIQKEQSNGKPKEIFPNRMSEKGFTIGRLEKREVAGGEYVRFTSTNKHEGYTNGERAYVEQVTIKAIVLKTQVGKTIEIDTKKTLPIDYAYASTGHSAQGLGAKRVLMEKETGSITTNHRSFYTDLTRAREEARIYTNDRNALPTSIVRQVDKTAALEVTQGRQVQHEMGR